MAPAPKPPSPGLEYLQGAERPDAVDDKATDLDGFHPEALTTPKALDRLRGMLDSPEAGASSASEHADEDAAMPPPVGPTGVDTPQPATFTLQPPPAVISPPTEAEEARAELESSVDARIETAVAAARAEAEAKLAGALADQGEKHEEVLRIIQEEAQSVERELADLQNRTAARDDQAPSTASAKEQVDARVRDARALAEAEFASRQAADAERHSETLAKMRRGTERIESRLAALQDEMDERLQALRQQAQAAQLAKVAEIEARAEATITQLHEDLDERLQRVREESDGRHAAELAQAAAHAEAQLARERADLVQRHSEELAHARAEVERLEVERREVDAAFAAKLEAAEARAEERLASAVNEQKSSAKAELDDALDSSEQRHQAEVRRIVADAEKTLADQLADAARKAERLRADAVLSVKKETEAEAQRRLETETSRVRAETRRTLADELESAQAQAAEQRKRAAEKAQAIVELDTAQALEDSLSRAASEQRLRAEISHLRSDRETKAGPDEVPELPTDVDES